MHCLPVCEFCVPVGLVSPAPKPSCKSHQASWCCIPAPAYKYLANSPCTFSCQVRPWLLFHRLRRRLPPPHLLGLPFDSAGRQDMCRGICDGRLGIGGGWERQGFPSVNFCICLSGTCLFYNSGMTFFLESKYVFVLLTQHRA